MTTVTADFCCIRLRTGLWSICDTEVEADTREQAIISFWQDRERQLLRQINQLSHENERANDLACKVVADAPDAKAVALAMRRDRVGEAGIASATQVRNFGRGD